MAVPYSEKHSLLEKLFGMVSSAEDQKADPVQISDETVELVGIFKTLGHEGRFLILCYLLQGERSVAEFERLLSARQSTVSQHLARLRMEGLVKARRDGNMIYYSLCDQRVAEIIRASAGAMGAPSSPEV